MVNLCTKAQIQILIFRPSSFGYFSSLTAIWQADIHSTANLKWISFGFVANNFFPKSKGIKLKCGHLWNLIHLWEEACRNITSLEFISRYPEQSGERHILRKVTPTLTKCLSLMNIYWVVTELWPSKTHYTHVFQKVQLQFKNIVFKGEKIKRNVQATQHSKYLSISVLKVSHCFEILPILEEPQANILLTDIKERLASLSSATITFQKICLRGKQTLSDKGKVDSIANLWTLRPGAF